MGNLISNLLGSRRGGLIQSILDANARDNALNAYNSNYSGSYQDPSEVGYGNLGFWNDFWNPDQAFWNNQGQSSTFDPFGGGGSQNSPLGNINYKAPRGNTLLDILSNWMQRFGR